MIPYGKYRFSHTVEVTRSVIIEGHGGEFNGVGATQIVADPGVTPLRFCYPGASSDGGNASDSILKDVNITAGGRDETTQIGDYDNNTRKIALSGPWNATVGQLIAIPGVGPIIKLTTVAVNSKSGSPEFTLHGNAPCGIWIGAYVIISPAGITEPTKIIKIDGTDDPTKIVNYSTFTLESNATSTHEGKDVVGLDIVCELITRVTAVEGNTTTPILTTDAVNSPGQSIIGTTIRHADAGVDIQVRMTCNNVSVNGMQGPGFSITASHGNVPATNANSFRIENCFVNRCEYGLYILGADTNAGSTDQLIGVGNRKWTIADLSFLGNTHSGLHSDGGYGAITLDTGTNRSVFIGTYLEGGTSAYLGHTTIMIGGTIAEDQGGWSWVDGIFNRFQVGETDGGAKFSSYRRLFYPTLFLEAYKTSTSQAAYSFLKINKDDNPNAAGWYTHIYQGNGQSPFCWSDNDAEGGAAQFWAPGGIQLGRQTNKLLNVNNKRTITYGNGPEPTAIDNPKNGDIVFNFSAAVGNPIGWIFVELVDPQDPNQSHWREFGQIQ